MRDGPKEPKGTQPRKLRWLTFNRLHFCGRGIVLQLEVSHGGGGTRYILHTFANPLTDLQRCGAVPLPSARATFLKEGVTRKDRHRSGRSTARKKLTEDCG